MPALRVNSGTAWLGINEMPDVRVFRVACFELGVTYLTVDHPARAQSPDPDDADGPLINNRRKK
jgi:hypothetical protein